MASGSVGELLRAAVERFSAPLVDYHALHEARIEAQSSDLSTVDLTPLTKAIKPLQKVPLRLGLPGCTVRVKQGCTVLLGFDAGDPTKPYAALFNHGSKLEEIHVKTETKVVVDSPLVELAGEGGGAPLARVGDFIQCSVILPGPPPTPQQVQGQILGPGSNRVHG